MEDIVFVEALGPQPDASAGECRHLKLQWKSHGPYPVVREEFNTATIVRDGITERLIRDRISSAPPDRTLESDQKQDGLKSDPASGSAHHQPPVDGLVNEYHEIDIAADEAVPLQRSTRQSAKKTPKPTTRVGTLEGDDPNADQPTINIWVIGVPPGSCQNARRQ